MNEETTAKPLNECKQTKLAAIENNTQPTQPEEEKQSSNGNSKSTKATTKKMQQWQARQKQLQGKARLAPGFSGAKQRGTYIEFSTASPELIAKVHQRFNRDIQLLLTDEPRYQTTRKQNMEKSNVLQRKMKKGVVTVADFADSGALWGYMKHKFTKRALLVFEAFNSILGASTSSSADTNTNTNMNNDTDNADTDNADLNNDTTNDTNKDTNNGNNNADATTNIHSPVLIKKHLLRPKIRVASIGGGPGNDIYGWVLFKELCCKSQGSNSDTSDHNSDTNNDNPISSDLFVFDFVADAWSPLVEKVSQVIQNKITCLPCNIKLPLNNCQENIELFKRCKEIDVYLFSFVLHECRDHWQTFLEQLWNNVKINCIFYFKEPSDWIIKLLISHFAWKINVDYWNVLGDGIVVIKK